MSDFDIFQYPSDNVIVVDSRLIASYLGINHSDWMQNIIRKYQTQTEQSFGSLRFENEVKKREFGGTVERFAWLTEEQALFYVTLSKNSLRVVECKARLVKSFIAYRQALRQRGVLPQPHSTIYIKRLENMADHKVSDHLWTTFRESAEILLMVEKQYKVPVEQMDLCDGSIGSHWSRFRESKDWVSPSEQYIHKFRDNRGERICKAYKYSEIPYFKAWLRDEYIPIHLPTYLVEKYGKRAVRQIYEEQSLLTEYILEITEERRVSSKQEELYEIFLAAREAIANRYLLGE